MRLCVHFRQHVRQDTTQHENVPGWAVRLTQADRARAVGERHSESSGPITGF